MQPSRARSSRVSAAGVSLFLGDRSSAQVLGQEAGKGEMPQSREKGETRASVQLHVKTACDKLSCVSGT